MLATWISTTEKREVNCPYKRENVPDWQSEVERYWKAKEIQWNPQSSDLIGITSPVLLQVPHSSSDPRDRIIATNEYACFEGVEDRQVAGGEDGIIHDYLTT